MFDQSVSNHFGEREGKIPIQPSTTHLAYHIFISFQIKSPRNFHLSIRFKKTFFISCHFCLTFISLCFRVHSKNAQSNDWVWNLLIWWYWRRQEADCSHQGYSGTTSQASWPLQGHWCEASQRNPVVWTSWHWHNWIEISQHLWLHLSVWNEVLFKMNLGQHLSSEAHKL